MAAGKVLVVVDHDGAHLNENARNVIACASLLGEDVAVLVAAEHVTEIAREAAQIAGVTLVLAATSSIYNGSAGENVAALVASLAAQYSHVLLAAGSYGKNIAPRLAALLDVQPIGDVIEVIGLDTFKRSTYAGNVLVTVRSRDAIKVLTIRPTAFPAAGQRAEAALVDFPPMVEGDQKLTQIKGCNIAHSDRPELSHARVVVSGGRGLGNAKNFEILTPLADKLGAALGASRAAVDLGFVPNTYQVGQTGKIVAPEVYIAIGISGAIQHMAGISDSKIIIAINNDIEAPICSVADYWLAEDLFTAVPGLVSALSS
ncbi:MAG TPA: FAD-binding protein [Herbaspirillum sp.]|jgi:electron transfer flavoprotein alpha subunit